MEQIQEASGETPAWVLNPRAESMGADLDSPIISARFFLGPDPRPDFVGNPIINSNGEIPVIEMIEIINRNDPKNSPMIQVATDHHRYRTRKEGGFPQEYREFKAGIEREATGYPIRDWLGNNDLSKNLGRFDIFTVEQLGAASDSLCQTLGPGTYDLRTKARAFLKNREGSAAAEQAIIENEKLRREMDEMKASLARLTAVNASQAARPEPEQAEEHPAEQLSPEPQRRGPGRPRAHAGE